MAILSGIVKDKETLLPIADAIVMLYNLSEIIELVTSTGDDGGFEFTSIAAATYKVRVIVGDYTDIYYDDSLTFAGATGIVVPGLSIEILLDAEGDSIGGRADEVASTNLDAMEITNDSIASAFDKLSLEVAGFWWTKPRYEPTTGEFETIVYLKTPRDTPNKIYYKDDIHPLKLRKDSGNIINYVVLYGKEIEEIRNGQTVSTRIIKTGKIQESVDKFGLRSKVINDPNVATNTQARFRLLLELQKNAEETKKGNLNIIGGDLSISQGDLIEVRGFYREQFDGTMYDLHDYYGEKLFDIEYTGIYNICRIIINDISFKAEGSNDGSSYVTLFDYDLTIAPYDTIGEVRIAISGETGFAVGALETDDASTNFDNIVYENIKDDTQDLFKEVEAVVPSDGALYSDEDLDINDKLIKFTCKKYTHTLDNAGHLATSIEINEKPPQLFDLLKNLAEKLRLQQQGTEIENPLNNILEHVPRASDESSQMNIENRNVALTMKYVGGATNCKLFIQHNRLFTVEDNQIDLDFDLTNVSYNTIQKIRDAINLDVHYECSTVQGSFVNYDARSMFNTKDAEIKNIEFKIHCGYKDSLVFEVYPSGTYSHNLAIL